MWWVLCLDVVCLELCCSCDGLLLYVLLKGNFWARLAVGVAQPCFCASISFVWLECVCSKLRMGDDRKESGDEKRVRTSEERHT